MPCLGHRVQNSWNRDKASKTISLTNIHCSTPRILQICTVPKSQVVSVPSLDNPDSTCRPRDQQSALQNILRHLRTRGQPRGRPSAPGTVGKIHAGRYRSPVRVSRTHTTISASAGMPDAVQLVCPVSSHSMRLLCPLHLVWSASLSAWSRACCRLAAAQSRIPGPVMLS